jgi:hypothetical protein
MKQEFRDQNINTSTQVSTLSKGVEELQKKNKAMEEGSKSIVERIEMVIPLIFNEIKEVRRGVNELAEELEHEDSEEDSEDDAEQLKDSVGEVIDDRVQEDEKEGVEDMAEAEEEDLSGTMADGMDNDVADEEVEQEVKIKMEEVAIEDGETIVEEVERDEKNQAEQPRAPLVSTLPRMHHEYKDPYEEVTDEEEESGEEEDDDEEDDDESVHRVISENSDMPNESSPEPESVLENENEMDSESCMDDDTSDAVIPSIEQQHIPRIVID